VPNRNTLAILLIALSVFGAGIAGYSIGRGTASSEALEANRRADSLVVVLAGREVALAAALAASDLTTAKVDSLKVRSAIPKARVRAIDLATVPDTCKTIVKTILANADTVFVTDSTALHEREGQVTRLTNELVKAEDLLFATRKELARQALRTQAPPAKKFLGLLPPPALSIGAGATLSGGRIYTGPTASLAWRVAF
jgi:hypothetical protein